MLRSAWQFHNVEHMAFDMFWFLDGKDTLKLVKYLSKWRYCSTEGVLMYQNTLFLHLNNPKARRVVEVMIKSCWSRWLYRLYPPLPMSARGKQELSTRMKCCIRFVYWRESSFIAILAWIILPWRIFGYMTARWANRSSMAKCNCKNSNRNILHSFRGETYHKNNFPVLKPISLIGHLYHSIRQPHNPFFKP